MGSSHVANYSSGCRLRRAAAQRYCLPSSDCSACRQRAYPPRSGERNLRAGGHFIISETADLLGMGREELIASLKSGKTLAGLAREKKGWSEDQYVQKLSEAASLKLDGFVREGKLTQEDAAKLKPGLPTLIKRSLHRAAQLHQGKPSQPPAATKAP